MLLTVALLPARRRSVVGLLALVVVLASCSSDDDPPPSPSRPSSTRTGPEVSESAESAPPAPSMPPRTVEVLPDGQLQLVAEVDLPHGSGDGEAGVLSNDDTVLVQSPSDVVVAVDPSTGQERWQTTLHFGRGDHACVTTALPPGATRAVFFGGFHCDARRVLDVASGALVDSVDPDELDLDRVLPAVVLGGWTYLVSETGSVQRVEPDGSTSEVGEIALAPDTFDDRGEYVDDVLASADTDVLVAQISRGVGSQRSKISYVGLRVGAAGSPAALGELWRVKATQALKGLALTVHRPDVGLGASLISRIDPAGKRFQLAQLDLDTGALTHRVALDATSLGGAPNWAVGFGGDDDSLVSGHQVFSTTVADPDPDSRLGLVDSITRYDLDAGAPAWTWAAPRTKKAILHTHAAPVAISDDGRFLYVGATGTRDPDVLVELDAATGRETRRFEVPADVPSLDTARFVVAGDLVLCFDQLFGDLPGRRPFLAVLQIR